MSLTFEYRQQQYQLNTSKVSIILLSCVIGLTASLAYWQYQRGIKKQAWLEQINTQDISSLAAIINEPEQYYQYQQIHTQGTWLAPLLLLDNQLYERKLGFYLYSILQTTQGNLLVRRGWVAANMQRNDLPTVTTLTASTKLNGFIYSPEANRFNRYWPEQFSNEQQVIPSIDTAKISQSLNIPLLPLVLNLPENTLLLEDEQTLTAVSLQQNLTKMPPERHFAYALQWLLLCLLAPIFYGFAAIEKVNKINNENSKQN